jgi:hypothetical protein
VPLKANLLAPPKPINQTSRRNDQSRYHRKLNITVSRLRLFQSDHTATVSLFLTRVGTMRRQSCVVPQWQCHQLALIELVCSLDAFGHLGYSILRSITYILLVSPGVPQLVGVVKAGVDMRSW